jgi:hypothetical protein
VWADSHALYVLSPLNALTPSFPRSLATHRSNRSLSTLFSNKLYKIGLEVAEDLIAHDQLAAKEWYPADQWEELQGIAREVGLKAELMAAVNTIYDFTASGGPFGFKACTSIVAQAANGSITHGRNLDYPLRTAMGPLTISVDFVRGKGQHAVVQYSAVTYAGFVGFNTGLKPGKM